MKIPQKLITSFLLASILLTNSCATIMTNWQDGKNTHEITEPEVKILKTEFNPTIDTIDKYLMITLKRKDFFNSIQIETDTLSKDFRWYWGFLTLLPAFAAGGGIGWSSYVSTGSSNKGKGNITTAIIAGSIVSFLIISV